MNRNIRTTLYILLVSCTVVSNGFGQAAKVAAADKQYNNFAYVDAITTYERVAEKGYMDEGMFQKLGNAYYFNADLPKAAKWYEALFSLNSNQDPEYYYRYAQCLKATEDYTKADKMLDAFYKKSGNDQRAKLYANNKNYLETIKANSGRYIIEDAGINSEYSDYGSAFYQGDLVYASAKDTGGVSKKVARWTNQSFTNLYQSARDASGNLGAPVRFNKTINSKLHESTPVFTKDGSTMYFTRNNFLKGKMGKDKEEVILLKLYRATNKNGQWEAVEALPFNSDQYSVAHPALSADEKTLYFASNMPGSLGQSDLYKVAINADGSYGSPENLGAAINTEARETFPFISQDNELYFASDGRPGLGGLDIYVSKITATGFSEVLNVGAPVNSPEDDFSLLLDSSNKEGYFTSNRPGGHGYDDIYKLIETRKIGCEQVLKGTIRDKDSQQVLSGAKVSLFNEKFVQLESRDSNADGSYRFAVDCGKVYYVRAEKESYQTAEGSITIANTSGESSLLLALEPRVKAITIGTDLAKTLNIPMIYFDLNKSNIRKDAAFELAKIVAVMQQYPMLKIDVRSHTDCRQTTEYNAKLSERRAQATKAWLIKNGIASNRLTAKGYGESQLVNNCGCEPTNESACSEEEHQKNRRSEFLIVSMGK